MIGAGRFAAFPTWTTLHAETHVGVMNCPTIFLGLGLNFGTHSTPEIQPELLMAGVALEFQPLLGVIVDRHGTVLRRELASPPRRLFSGEATRIPIVPDHSTRVASRFAT